MKKTIHLQVFSIAFLLLPFQILSQDYVWAKQVGVIANDNVIGGIPQGNDIAKDSDGNIFIAGSFGGTLQFGDSTVVSSTISGGGITLYNQDGYIAKYSSEGSFLWIETFPAALMGNVEDIEIDASGNIYALMSFLDTITILDTEVVGDEGFVVVKMDANLNLIWHQPILRVGGAAMMGANSLALNSNDVIISGLANDDVTIDGTSIPSEFPGLIASFNNQNGNLNWAKSLGYFNNISGDLSSDAAGNVYWVTTIGEALTSFDIEGVTIDPSHGPVAVFIKFDASGNVSWVKTISNEMKNPIWISQVEVNPATGDIFTLGTWGDTLNIDGIELVTTELGSLGGLLWLAKFNSIGEIQWVKTSNESASASSGVGFSFMNLESSPDGGVFIASEGAPISVGEGNKEVFFDNGDDGFLIKYSTAGEIEWLRKLGCLGPDCDYFVRGLAAISANQVALTGIFSQELDLNEETLVAVVPSTVPVRNIYLKKIDGDLMSSVFNFPSNNLQFQIAPNPTSDFLQIKLLTKGYLKNGQIEIIDLMGKIIFQTNWTSSSTQNISLPNLPSGTYFLRLQGDNYYGIQKLVIQY